MKILLFFCCLLAIANGDFYSYLKIDNDTPYVLDLTQAVDTDGNWLIEPANVEPYTSGTATLKDSKNPFYGSDGTVFYSVLIAKRVPIIPIRDVLDFNIHFSDGLSSNKLDIKPNPNEQVSLYIYPPGFYGLPVRTAGSIVTLSVSTKVKDATCSDSGDWKINQVSDDGSPLCVRFGFRKLDTTMGTYRKKWTSSDIQEGLN